MHYAVYERTEPLALLFILLIRLEVMPMVSIACMVFHTILHLFRGRQPIFLLAEFSHFQSISMEEREGHAPLLPHALCVPICRRQRLAGVKMGKGIPQGYAGPHQVGVRARVIDTGRHIDIKIATYLAYDSMARAASL